MITPMEIYQREFKRKALNGLDPEDVEDFLFQVAEDMEALMKENAELKQNQGGGAPASRQEPQPAAVDDDRSAQALEQAQAEAARIKAKAEAEARGLLNRAKAQAEKISRQQGGEGAPAGAGDSSERIKKYQDMLVRHLSQVTLLLDEEGEVDESGELDPSTDLSSDSAPEGTGTTLLEPDANDARE